MNPTPTSEPTSPALRVHVSSHDEATNAQLRRSPSGHGETRSARLFHRMCLLVLLIVVSAASFSAFYQKWHFREQGARGTDLIAEFDRMIDGTAHRPYIYRQMIPDLANSLTRVLPVDAISRRVPQRAKDRISVAFNLTSKAYPAQYLIFYIATYLFALFAAVALYKVCTAANLAEPLAVFAAVVFMLLFPLFGVKGGYFCDYPELCFMAVAVWIALKLDWWWVIPIAALGTWNKESFLLFMFTLYPLFRQRHSRMNSLIGVGVLVAVCAAVYLPIRLHFAHNPGGTVEWHLKDQMSFYLHPFQLDTWVDRTYDLMFPALSAPIPTVLLIWTVWRGWRFLPLRLKGHAQIAAVINIPLFLLFCQPGEFRDLSMLYVSFLFILAFNLQEWMGSAGLKRVEAAA
ncbi:MAG TPA: hypothetical protein VK574_01580 [Terracidiphilus sp.]|nr:hypothetical protein [Terracidiphilus sp.]